MNYKERNYYVYVQIYTVDSKLLNNKVKITFKIMLIVEELLEKQV